NETDEHRESRDERHQRLRGGEMDFSEKHHYENAVPLISIFAFTGFIKPEFLFPVKVFDSGVRLFFHPERRGELKTRTFTVRCRASRSSASRGPNICSAPGRGRWAPATHSNRGGSVHRRCVRALRGAA